MENFKFSVLIFNFKKIQCRYGYSTAIETVEKSALHCENQPIKSSPPFCDLLPQMMILKCLFPTSLLLL